MGYRPIRTIGDCQRHGLKLQVTCRRCGRVAIFSPGDFLYWRTVRLDLPLDRLAGRLICQGAFQEKGCGARGPTVQAIDWPPVEPTLPPPKPIATKVPAGVDPAEWAKAGPSDRKRLIRRARG
ncbi:MAG TPA: hypothetical protein VFT56_01085 [Sphingomonas sp.]|nr:hypothetical protein [Sphingomonas sp.]